MIAPLVISDRGVTVIGGGATSPYDLQTALAVAPTLVAADGGADRALALGQPPDWVIGDLDSITSGARSWADLPAAAIKYVRRVEELIQCPVALLSTSPERDDTILVTDPFED